MPSSPRISDATPPRARTCSRRAVALEPEHLRGLWSLGHARTLLAEDRRNHGDLEEARAQLAQPGDHGSLPWLRFKALEWRGEVLMRAGRFVVGELTVEAFFDRGVRGSTGDEDELLGRAAAGV